MKNKTLGKTIIGVMVFAIIAGVIEADLPNVADAMYAVAGLGFIVFGIWGGIVLIKSDNE